MKRLLTIPCFLVIVESAFATDGHVKSDSSQVPLLAAQANHALGDSKQRDDSSLKETEEPVISAPDAPSPIRRYLSGDWGGVRDDLSDSGIEFSFVSKSDNLANVSGGISRGTAYIHNIDLTAMIDGEKAFGLTGTSCFIHVLSNNGGGLNVNVGDAQMVSNIEAKEFTKIYQAWIQKAWFDGGLSLLAGLYDFNSEFYVTKTSALFLNGSHGVGKELSQTGLSGPSIFPNTSAAVRMFVQPFDNVILQATVLDAVPGRPNDPFSPSIHFDRSEGAFVCAEIGYSRTNTDPGDRYFKCGVGYWVYTSSFPELTVNENDQPTYCTDNVGAYLLAEGDLFHDDNSPSRGLSVFARLGFSSSCINLYDYHLGVGAVYTGIIKGRDEDKLGIAIAQAHGGPEFRENLLASGVRIGDAEVSVELTYRAIITQWLVLQPNFQRIVHPSLNAEADDASVVGARIEVNF